MDADKIIAKGDTAKYQVVITHEDFDQQEDDFNITLHYGMMGGSVSFEKSDFVQDEDGNFFLLFNTADMVGWVNAETHYFVPDTDLASGVREEVEWHMLGFVTSNPCPQFACECDCTAAENNVVFTRVWRGDVNTLYLNLRTADGENLVDSEGNNLRVRKSELN